MSMHPWTLVIISKVLFCLVEFYGDHIASLQLSISFFRKQFAKMSD